MARMTDELIGSNIRAARIRAGYKRQEELAARLGMSRNTYSKIECNPMEYPIAKLRTVAAVIGCPVEDFFKD